MSGGGSCGCGQANCGCCEGVRVLTPRAIHNRPGLSALDARIGTHGSFLATMKARLTSHILEPGRTRPLAGLRVRDDDAAIALLDGWASVADVLTFYQERIVNEGYLRTATEMRSVHGLAGLVGYTPRPGVAASVFLSYTLDEKATDEVIIPKGARSQAVPGPGELPQFFETSEDLPARAAWNLLGVRRTEPLWWSMGLIDDRPEYERELYLAGTATRLQAGDPLLIAVREDLVESDEEIIDGWARPAAVRVIAVEPDVDAGRTRIRIQSWVPDTGSAAAPAAADLDSLRADAPTGLIAGEILALLDELPAATADPATASARIAAMRAALEAQLGRVGGLPAQRLRAWARRVDEALAAMIDPDQPAPPPRCSMEALVKKLIVDPSRPPPSATHLPGSVKRRFEQAGDGGLALLSQTSVDLAAQLAAGLKGCVADAEVPVRVYALRLRGNLFGHNALKQRETLLSFGTGTGTGTTATSSQQRSTTIEIGEWPIVSADPNGQGFIRREQPDRLDVDGSHDGILPGSWLFVDMTGVPDHRAAAGAQPTVAVACSGRYAVGQIVSAQPKMSRADYGLTGPITRIRFESRQGWIVLATDDQLLANNRALLRQPVADMDYESIRGATVWAASEELALAESPIAAPVCVERADQPIELNGLYLGLEPGRYLMVSGERADIENVEGVMASEPAMIAAVVHDVRVGAGEVEPWSHAVRRAQEAASTPAPIQPVAGAAPAADSARVGNASLSFLIDQHGGKFVLAARPGNGTATVDAATGALEYRPDAGFNGVDEFSVEVPGAGVANIAVRVTANAGIIFSINCDSPLLSAQSSASVCAPANLLNEAGTTGGTPQVFINPTTGTPYLRGVLQPLPRNPADDRVDEREIELPAKFPGDALHTFIWLARPLSYCYRRASLSIQANVVKATHGESQQEILGNGDGARPHQSFTLKHAPLTWLPSPTASGAEDTLDVYVNDIRWNGVASFTDLPPTARAYTIRTDHKGVSSVMFGDGREGARLPTGSQNVVARYRSGLGKAGNVRAGQIQQLVTRPLGVKEVVNPYRASGGADPESADQIRSNAPLGTAALGRLVATRDYADFARTFAGIGKAAALEISDGRRSVVHLTIAGEDDIPIDDGSELMRALRAALRDLGDPFQGVVIAARELLLLVIEARLAIEPDRLWEPVVTAARAALLEAFGFGRRALGQGVAASEVVKVIQAVDGVAMVDLDLFGALPTIVADPDGPRPATPAETSRALAGLAERTATDGVAAKVDAAIARSVNGALRPAQLAILSAEVAATLVLNQIVEAP